jgi:anti-sigma regulatory factor (Ser/Thr protein kinase)
MMAERDALLDVDLPAVAESAPRARRAVLDALGDLPVDRDAVGVVVSEAVANAVMHAYRDQPNPGRVRISAGVTGNELEIDVADDGLGMIPRLDSPGVGLGLPLISELADHVQVDGRRGTRVHASFDLFGPAGPHGRALRRRGSGGLLERRSTRIRGV